MDNISKIVGDRIRIIRAEKGLSLEELAHRSGMDPTHLGRLERGERNPSLVSLDKIITGLGITLEDLFKYIQPSQGNANNTTISLLINRLNTLSLEDQKLMLNLLDVVFKLMKQ